MSGIHVICPVCEGLLDDEGEIHCTRCGFTLAQWSQKFAPAPQPTGLLNDFAGIVPRKLRPRIEAHLKSFFTETQITFAIVVVQDVYPLLPSQYAFWLFNTWGVGGPENLGLLLLLTLKQHCLQTEVGLGLEAYLSTQATERILKEEVIPHVRNGMFGLGLLKGTEAFIAHLKAQRP